MSPGDGREQRQHLRYTNSMENTMTSTSKFTGLAIGMMSLAVLVASPAFAQPAPAKTAEAQKQRTQDTGPNCDFSVPTSRLSPDCQNIKQGLEAAKVK
jgi:hypothetical protein